MTIFQNRKKLFRQPTTAEKLVMFQSLLDSHDIQPKDALAWLGSIHAELRQPHKGQDSSVYARYARTIESLRHQSPDIHQYVITNWQAYQPESRISDFDQFIAKLGGVDSGIKNVHEAGGEAMQDAESSEGAEGDGGEIGEAGEDGGEEQSDESIEVGEKEGQKKEEEEFDSEEEKEREKEEESKDEEEKDESGEEESEVEEEETEKESETEAGEEAKEEAEDEPAVEKESEDSEIAEVKKTEGESYRESARTESTEADGGIMATEAAEAAEHMTELTYVPIEDELGPDEAPFMEAGE